MNQSVFSVRMNSQLKKEFSLICEDFGLPVSTAVTLFAKAVVRERRIPFEIRSNFPNETTRNAIELAESGKNLCGPFSTVDELRESLDA